MEHEFIALWQIAPCSSGDTSQEVLELVGTVLVAEIHVFGHIDGSICIVTMCNYAYLNVCNSLEQPTNRKEAQW